MSEFKRDYLPGQLVKLRNPDSIYKDKTLTVIKELEEEEDDDYSQTGQNYLLRAFDQKKITAYACELDSVAPKQNS
jgi:hypothetical protein